MRTKSTVRTDGWTDRWRCFLSLFLAQTQMFGASWAWGQTADSWMWCCPSSCPGQGRVLTHQLIVSCFILAWWSGAHWSDARLTIRLKARCLHADVQRLRYNTLTLLTQILLINTSWDCFFNSENSVCVSVQSHLFTVPHDFSHCSPTQKRLFSVGNHGNHTRRGGDPLFRKEVQNASLPHHSFSCRCPILFPLWCERRRSLNRPTLTHFIVPLSLSLSQPFN